MSPTLRRLFIVLTVLVTVILLGGQLRESLGIELEVESVRDFAVSLGPMGPLLFIGVVAVRGLLALPSQVVLIAAGLCFGTVVGTLVGGAGLTISGLAFFLGMRYASREAVKKRFSGRLGRVLEAMGHRAGALTLAIACAYPISPLSPIHAAAGITPMSVGTFIAAAFAGGTARAAIFAYFGNAITESNQAGFVYAAVALGLVVALPLAFEGGRTWVRTILGLEPSAAQDED